MIQEIYDLAGYDLTLDYAAPPTPPLGKEDATWAGEQVRMVEKNLFASP
ncbi:MAG: DUF4058 family protein [Anaerolineales bacterium]